MILSNDSLVSAQFSADEGFRLTSFKKGSLEVIDPTSPLFVGLRLKSDCPMAPWTANQVQGYLSATLTGENVWNGTSLAAREGQAFKLQSTARLEEATLRFSHSVVSDTDSLVGNLFHLRLPQGPSHIEIDAKDHYYDAGQLQPLLQKWQRSEDGRINLPLDSDLNIGMHPLLNPTEGTILLITSEYIAEVGYQSTNQESCWLIQYQRENPYISIGAVSSQNPWKPNLTVSSINLSLRIL